MHPQDREDTLANETWADRTTYRIFDSNSDRPILPTSDHKKEGKDADNSGECALASKWGGEMLSHSNVATDHLRKN